MAFLFDAPATPDAITAFVRQVPLPSTLALSALFPTQTVATNEFRWSEVTETNRMASFRAWDSVAHVAQRDTATEKSIKFPALTDSSQTHGEYERLQEEFARLGGSNTDALAKAIYDDAEKLVRNIRNRMEMAIGDVLTDGKLTLNEGGIIQEADFGIPTENLIAPSAKWDQVSDAQVLSDFVAWFDAYRALTGSTPGTIISSLKVKRLVQQNKELIDAVYGATAGRTRVNDSQLTDAIGAEAGAINWIVYDTVLKDDANKTVRVLPEDKLFVLPSNPGDALEVRYGQTASALELVKSPHMEMAFSDAPGLVGFVDKGDVFPYREKTFVDACGMPILKDARQLMVASVL